LVVFHVSGHMRGPYTRLVTLQLAERMYEYLLENRERFRLYGRDVLKVNVKRVQKELGLKPQLTHHLLSYMEQHGMVRIVEKRRRSRSAVYFVELRAREQAPVEAFSIFKNI